MATVAELFAAASQHYRAGQHDRAIECLQAVLSLQPNIAEAHSNLGILLGEQGRLPEAVASLREAVRLRPENAQAHGNLGNVLRKQGSIDQAITHLQQAVRLQPALAEAHNNLGLALAQRGLLAEAVASLQMALHCQPNYAEVHNNLGEALCRQGYHKEGEGHLRQALHLRPDLANAHYNLGLVLQEQRQLRAAEASLRRALLLKPDFVEPTNTLGLVLREQGRFDEARASFQQALRLNPSHADTQCSLGALLEDLGDLEAAAGCYREALRHQPAHAGALSGLGMMLRAKLPEPELAQLRDQVADPYLCEAQRCRLLFALAHVLDARREYAPAAAHLKEANALVRTRWQRRGQAFDAAEFGGFIERLMQAFRPAFFERVRGWGLPSERPVFIFGLPRSGTTLTEQILASHSQVHGGGELGFAETDFEALGQLTAAPGSVALLAASSARALLYDRAFAALEDLDQPAVHHLARQHLSWLESLNPTRARVTSKMPANWRFLGLLATLFPRARFIHCRRDLRDVAVSCWMTPLQLMNWTCDLDDIAAQFEGYERLMAHWRATLPVPMLEIDYEQMVADLEGTARRLVSWLGLDWEPACLEFHKTQRPIRTASVTQVRQPIYQSSVGRWPHYADALAPLLARLPSGA